MTFFSLKKKEKAYTCKLKKRESKSKGSKVAKSFEADKKKQDKMLVCLYRLMSRSRGR